MANKRAFSMITLSLALGVAAAWMAGKWMQRAALAEEVPMANVVAAEIAIPFGTKVESELVLSSGSL